VQSPFRNLRRNVALISATLMVAGGFVSLPMPASAATLTSGKCVANVDNTAGVVVTESGKFCYVAFKSTGINYSWTRPSGVSSIDLLVVAGGGGGGARHAGGGGAGGLIQEQSVSVGSASLTVSVGAGGAGGPYQSGGNGAEGSNGSNSAISGSGFTTRTAIGGGGGGWGTVGSSGGSGGGAGCCVGAGSSGTPGQGNAGSSGTFISGSLYIGGAGGGAGAAATAANSSTQIAGIGGAGASVSWITTTVRASLAVGVEASGASYFAGGGGGGTAANGTGGSGGVGGGGTGSTYQGTPSAGLANTGGGGGGGGMYADNTSPAGGAGGSGVVVIRYVKTAPMLSYNASDINSYDSAAGAAVNDLAIGSNYDGTIITGANGQTPTFNQATGAWQFAGDGSTMNGPYIDVANISTTPFNTHGFTIDFEADFGVANNWERIIDFSEGGSQNDNILVARVGTTNTLALEVYTGATGSSCQYANAIPSSSEMVRWTITIDGSNCRMYKTATRPLPIQ
jgi:hypothetical protein